MIDNNNINDIVQGAFDFSLEQQVKGRTRNNNASTITSSTDTSLLYKNEIQHNSKITKLVSKLEETKESVLKGILLSRKYEKSINIAKQAESLLRNHVSNNFNKPNGGDEGQERTSFYWLIENLSGIPKGYGYYIDTELQRYNDEVLCKELTSLPSSFFENFNADIFSKIAEATSSNHITGAEATAMYKYALDNLNNRYPDINKKKLITLLWTSLIHMLRRKLMIIHLIKLLPRNFRNNSLPPLVSSSLSSSSVTSMKSTSLSKKMKKGLFSTSNDTNNYMILKDSLTKSKTKQEGLGKSITSSLISIVNTKAAPIPTKGGHSSALKFARHIGVRKIQEICNKIDIRTLNEAWRRWIDYKDLTSSEKSVNVFVKYVGIGRVFDIFAKDLKKKLIRNLRKFKKNTEWFDTLECLAAVIEVQRVWRGGVARVRQYRLHRLKSIIIIQKIMRGYLGRKKYRLKLHAKKTISSVMLIERLWRKFAIKRHQKKLNLIKRQNLMRIVIQRVYRGHRARNRVRKIRHKYNRIKGATKMQSLWRRYRAVLRVSKLSHIRRKHRAATKIQKVGRGMLGRLTVKDIHERHAKATLIQYFFWCFKARKERRRRFLVKCAIKMQKIVRGRHGRNRFKHIKAQHLWAKSKIYPIALGFVARRKYCPILPKHTARRIKAANRMKALLQAFLLARVARARVAQRRIQILQEKEEKKLKLKRNTNAIKIQRIIRGFVARKRVERIRFRRMKPVLPSYYQIKSDYFQTQYYLHRKQILKIQCFFRCVKARMVTKHKRIRREINKANEKKRAISIFVIQRIVRGIVARRRVRKLIELNTKNNQANITKYLCKEVRCRNQIKRAIANHRAARELRLLRNKSATKIQALARKYIQRCDFIRNYKRLARDRANRIRDKRNKAAIIIQSFQRMNRARSVVERRRQTYAEELKTRKMMLELDGKIEDMHGEWMNDLLAIRIESGARVKLARNKSSKRGAENQKLSAEKLQELQKESATKIQALMRGILSRKLFKKQLPLLKKELRMRSFCVECEKKVANRRCRQCKDRFCEICYITFHKKGHRREHNWEPVVVFGVKPGTADKDSRTNTAATSSKPSTALAAKPATNKKDWEEFFDANAKAKYWFNKTTGEAVWVKPY